MKLKQSSLLALIFGLVSLLSGLAAPIIYLNNHTSQHGAIGIIGGAGAPSYTFTLSALFNGLPLVLVILGTVLVVSALFCLLFSKTVKTHCTKATSATALGLSCIGAAGLLCAFTWFAIVSFGKMAEHPIKYPVSTLLGIICICAFAALIALYCKIRRKKWSVIGFLIDILTSIVYLPTLLYVFAYLFNA